MYGFTDGIDALNRTGRSVGSQVFTYDAENRLKTANGTTYTYDGDGNRVSKLSPEQFLTQATTGTGEVASGAWRAGSPTY